MGLVSSGTAKGEKPIMPAVPNATEETPVVLEKVDIGGGNIIKMSPADKKAFFEGQAEAERSRTAWEATTRGDAPASAADGTADDAAVLVRYLNKDELVAVAERYEVGTSGSKAKIAARIVSGSSEPEEEPEPEPETEDQEPA